MREIKFRAFAFGCMQYAGQFQFDQFNDIPFTKDNIGFFPMEGIESGEIITGNIDQDKVIIMQYTGLKDKNGVEIYEGDRIKENDITGIIKWVGCAFMIEWQADCYSDLLGWENYKRGILSNGGNYEIIGNIYKNPELLK